MALPSSTRHCNGNRYANVSLGKLESQLFPDPDSSAETGFSFWSFEIRECILRNQKIIIGLDSFSSQDLIYLAPF